MANIKLFGNTKIQGKAFFDLSEPEPTYSIEKSVSSVDEGASVTFTLTTTNVANGTEVPYTITGISAADITSGTLTGNFTINNNTATVTITATADQLTEGAETATLTLDNVADFDSVTVNDTSKTPLYSLTSSSASVNEGSSVTFTLSTANVANGTSVPYVISGISSGDLSSGSLTGSFTVSNGSASTSITLANDVLTEGTETATLSTSVGSVAVTVNDTSRTPTYAVTADNNGNINEGTTVTFTLNTTNVSNGTLVPYTITGITQEDLSSGLVTGNFTVNNNTATTSITLANDVLTEGSETLKLALDNRATINGEDNFYEFQVIDSSRPFSPEDLTDLIAHWDYRTGVYKDTNYTPAVEGDGVRVWSSRYGNKFLPQSTLSLQPAVLADKGLYFNNKAMGELSVFSNEFLNINGPLTYYIVGKNFFITSGTETPIVRFGNFTTPTTHRFSFGINNIGAFRISNGTSRVTDIETSNRDNLPIIVSANFNNGNGNVYKKQYGGETIQSYAATGIGTGLNNTNQPNSFTLGGRLFSSATQTLADTTIYHVLVYKAIHTDYERLQVMNYLKASTLNGSVSF